MGVPIFRGFFTVIFAESEMQHHRRRKRGGGGGGGGKGGGGGGGGQGGPGPPNNLRGGANIPFGPPNNPPICTGKTIPLNSILEFSIISYFKMRNVIIWH